MDLLQEVERTLNLVGWADLWEDGPGSEGACDLADRLDRIEAAAGTRADTEIGAGVWGRSSAAQLHTVEAMRPIRTAYRCADRTDPCRAEALRAAVSIIRTCIFARAYREVR